MGIGNIFKISYYFDSYTNPDFKLLLPLVIVVGLILIATIILQRKFNKLHKQFSGDKRLWWTHWLNIGYTYSIVSLIYLFFRYENIPYFNWRLWPALLVLGIIGWIGYLMYYRKVVLPKKQADREERKGVATYFRRRKRAK